MRIASRLFAWLILAGWPAEQVLHATGVRIPGPAGDGGRIPDLTVWRVAPSRGVWLPVDDLLLIVEIISSGSSGIDAVTKRDEYAAGGVPRYWVVGRDNAQTVTMYALTDDKAYERTAEMPLAWLLNTSPDTHLGPPR